MDKSDTINTTPTVKPRAGKDSTSPITSSGSGSSTVTLPSTGTVKKKNTSLRLDNKTLKALKIRAIEEDTSIQKLIEHLIQAYLDGHITLKKGSKQT